MKVVNKDIGRLQVFGIAMLSWKGYVSLVVVLLLLLSGDRESLSPSDEGVHYCVWTAPPQSQVDTDPRQPLWQHSGSVDKVKHNKVGRTHEGTHENPCNQGVAATMYPRAASAGVRGVESGARRAS